MRSDQRLTVPQVARLLGISERGVRDKIEKGQLRGEKEGKRWLALVPADDAAADAVVRGSASGSTRGSDAVVDAGGQPPEVGASNKTTPAEVERAIARTGQQYTADLRTMFEELREVYEGQLAAKDQTIAAKDETIAGQADTIAELRRWVATAEAERDELRGEVRDILSLAASAPLSEAPKPRVVRLPPRLLRALVASGGGCGGSSLGSEGACR
jgi:excisionase family DNA binding protein